MTLLAPYLAARGAPLLFAGLSACDTIGIGGGGKGQGHANGRQRTPILSRISNEVKPDPTLADVSVVLPPAQENPEWTQAGGTAAKAAGHLALADAPVRAWTASIAGSSSTRRLATAPVVGGGTLFAVDTQGTVHAFDAATGAKRWEHRVEVASDSGTRRSAAARIFDARFTPTTARRRVRAGRPTGASCGTSARGPRAARRRWRSKRFT